MVYLKGFFLGAHDHYLSNIRTIWENHFALKLLPQDNVLNLKKEKIAFINRKRNDVALSFYSFAFKSQYWQYNDYIK